MEKFLLKKFLFESLIFSIPISSILIFIDLSQYIQRGETYPLSQILFFLLKTFSIILFIYPFAFFNQYSKNFLVLKTIGLSLWKLEKILIKIFVVFFFISFISHQVLKKIGKGYVSQIRVEERYIEFAKDNEIIRFSKNGDIISKEYGKKEVYPIFILSLLFFLSPLGMKDVWYLPFILLIFIYGYSAGIADKIFILPQF